MIKIDEENFRFLKQNGHVVNGEERLDFMVRWEIEEKLQKGEYSDQEALEDDVRALFDEQGREATAEDIALIKKNIVAAATARLVLDIMRDERIFQYQKYTTFPDEKTGERRYYGDIIAENKAKLDQIEENPDSYFEGFFKGNQKA